MKWVFLIALSWLTLCGYAQDLRFARSIHHNSSVDIAGMVMDHHSNTYIAGKYRGNINVGDSIQAFVLNGWAFALGNGQYNQEITGLQLISDELWVSGALCGDLDVDPDSNVIQNLNHNDSLWVGLPDAALLRYSTEGRYLKGLNLGSPLNDYLTSFTIRPDGKLVVCGTLEGYIDLNPDTGQYWIVNVGTLGVLDIFMACYDTADYHFNWGFRMGTPQGTENLLYVVADSSNHTLIAGTFTETMDFNPSPSASNSMGPDGSFGYFIARYNQQGEYITVRRMLGNTGFDELAGMYLDENQNLYLWGSFTDTVDFNLSGPVVFNQIANGHHDGFVWKMQSNLNFQWLKVYGSPGNNESVKGLHFHGMNEIWLTGEFQGILDCDPGSGMAQLTATGGKDYFIIRNDGQFNYSGAFHLGGSGNEQKLRSYLNTSSRLGLLGTYASNFDCDLGSDTVMLEVSAPQNLALIHYDLMQLPVGKSGHKKKSVRLFPNPGSSGLSIEGLEKGDRLSCYSSAGILLWSVVSESTEYRNDGDLIPASGLYFFLITRAHGESEVLKWIKE
jgi:hypothetical protein